MTKPAGLANHSTIVGLARFALSLGLVACSSSADTGGDGNGSGDGAAPRDASVDTRDADTPGDDGRHEGGDEPDGPALSDASATDGAPDTDGGALDAASLLDGPSEDGRPGKGWTFAGGGVHGGGFQNALAFAPDKRSLVLSASDVSGVQRSTDSGEHWATVDVGLSDQHVAAVTFDPDTANHAGRVYVGVGTGGGNVDVSDDYGTTWRTFCPGGPCPDFQSNNGVPHQADEHPRSTGHLLEVVHPSPTTTCLLAATYDQGLERSRSDLAGGAWSVLGLAPGGGATHYLRGLAYDAARDTAYVASVGDPPSTGAPIGQGVYAVTHACGDGARSATPVAGAPSRVEELAWIGGALYTAGDTGVFRYEPGGAWSPMNDGLPLGSGRVYESISGVAQGSGVVLFVGATNASANETVLRWNGAKWLSVSAPGDFTTSILGISPAETWWLTGDYLLDGSMYVASQIVLDATEGAPRVWIAGRSGVYRSNGCSAGFDGCTFQVSVDQMGVAVGRSIALDPRVDGTVYYGDTDYTFFGSTDGLVHVDHTPPAGGNCRALAVDALASASGVSPVYVGLGNRNDDSDGGVFMNANPAGAGGAPRGAWKSIDFSGAFAGQRVWSLVAGHPAGVSGPVVLATLDGGLGVWRSVDGAAFARISPASSAMAGTRAGYFQAAAMYWPAASATTSSQRVYLYDFGSGLYCSNDGGKTFTDAPVWAQRGNRSSLAGNPADPSSFYLSNGTALYRFSAPLGGTCSDAALTSPVPVENAGKAFGGLGSIAVDPGGRLFVPANDGSAGQLFMSSSPWTAAAPVFTDIATDDYRAGARDVRDLVVDRRGYVYMARSDNATYVGTPH